ncbi:hypothetical protein HTG_13520 [Natrinema mahii]|nr:hypothetical protein HTG_13520 [Natrinema mahii]
MTGVLYSLETALRTDNLRNPILYEPPIQVGDNELDIVEELTVMRALVERDENEPALVRFGRVTLHVSRSMRLTHFVYSDLTVNGRRGTYTAS